MANLNLNKVILGGRLTADPEIKTTPNGVKVTSFSVAVNRKGTNDKTDFLDVVAWRQTAEFITRFFRKGSSICIVGNIQKREYIDKNGQKRYITEVVADEAYFVDSKNDSGSAPEMITPNFEEISDDEDLPF